MQKMIELENLENNLIEASISCLSRGDKVLIENSEINLSEHQKVALIGRNGSGKSTLLETLYYLNNKEPLDDSIGFDGSIQTSIDSGIGYLPQDVKLNFEGTVRGYIDAQLKEKASIYNRYQELIIDESEKEREELIHILSLMDDYFLWNYELEIEKVLSGLSIPQPILQRNIRTLSGGEATKIALASLLLSKPKLILLDEPTNNLDSNNIKFLEEWFKKSPSSLIVVSHDREFLDNVIDNIWEIDEETKVINTFGGNYSFYENEKKKQFEGRVRDYEQQQKERKRLEKDVKRLKTSANNFESTSNNDFYRAKGARIAKAAKIREKRVKTELSKLGEPKKPMLPKFILREAEKIEGTVLKTDNLNFQYGKKKIFENLSIKIVANERVSISGVNGVGKSTLLKIFSEEIESNSLYKRDGLRFAYLPQSIIPENPKQDILSYMREHISMNEDDLIDTLGKVIFSNPTYLTVGDFSIGELKRIQLSLLFSSSPNVLLLDEPTNHLDIHTLNMLERTLREFKHTLIVVSHDREFLKRIKVDRDINLD